MTQNNEKSVVNITVNVVGVQEANQLVERLCEKIKEARTLAGDLTSLVESLEVNQPFAAPSGRFRTGSCGAGSTAAGSGIRRLQMQSASELTQ